MEVEVEEALFSNFSMTEQMKSLAMAIVMCEVRELSDKIAKLVEGLRGLQRKIRWEEEQMKQEKLTQHRITHYFSAIMRELDDGRYLSTTCS